MPRHLSLATAIDKNRISSDVAYLMCLEVDVINEDTLEVDKTIRLVRNDEDIVYRGETYTKVAFEFDITESAEGVPEVTLQIQDPTGDMIKDVDDYGGAVGWKVRLLYISTQDFTLPPEVETLVFVISAQINEYSINFQLGARNPIYQRFPRRIQWRDRCGWLYKSQECGYTGPLTSCDYTLQGDNGCSFHNNAHRFGGFPGIRSR